MTYIVQKTIRGRENRAYGSPAGRENIVKSAADSPTPPPLQYIPTAYLPTGVSASIAWSANVATVTATAHGLTKGDIGRITGATEAYFNGDFRADSVADANTWTYQLVGTSLAASASGSPVSQKVQDRIEF